MAASKPDPAGFLPILLSSNSTPDPIFSPDVQLLTKQIHDALLTTGRANVPTECDLSTFHKLLFNLVSRQSESPSESPELAALKRETERVAVLWLAAVPRERPTGDDGKGRGSWKHLSACDPSLDLTIKCPTNITNADMFLSSTFMQSQRNMQKQRAPTVSQLVLSTKELGEKNFPVPSPGSVIMDRDKTAWLQKFNFFFMWGKKRFVSLYDNFDTCPKVSDLAPLFAIDCEMVKTEDDPMALARVAVVSQSGKCVYNTYVRPPGTVVDYLTQYSGITPGMLDQVHTTLSMVQDDLLFLLPKPSILVGQSLENDLQALQFAHPYIIDTSVIFLPNKYHRTPSLAHLAQTIMSMDMRRGCMGHDPIVDATTALDLVLMKVSAPCNVLLGEAMTEANSLFDLLSDFKVPSIMIDTPALVDKFVHSTYTLSYGVTTDQVALCYLDKFPKARFCWLQLHLFESLSRPPKRYDMLPSVEKKAMQIEDGIVCFRAQVPPGSLCAIFFDGCREKDWSNHTLQCRLFIKR